MSVINTNITSMIAQKNLNASRNSLTTSMERLSSGMRINSAKDDAAGQAIANRMTAQIKGLTQAQRNANDGISIAQTAEGALNQINDNVQRIRELTVQAANGTNSDDDLASIQEEINQRLTEVDRISRETNFNGTAVLAKNQGIAIQVGANDGEAITVNLKQINKTSLGLGTFTVEGQPKLAAVDIPGGSVVTAGNTTYTIAATGITGAASRTIGTGDVSFTGKATTNTSLFVDDAGQYYVSTKDAEGVVSYYTATIAVTAGTATATPKLAITSAGDPLTNLTPLQTLDTALNQIDSLRSELGAVQNRFMDAITNLGTNETNLSAARSRIQDADYAVEVANMTRAQILQQAGTSVLAQANQIPQNVLSLLG